MSTPIEFYEKIYVKRDDLFCVGKATGGKARGCYLLGQAALQQNRCLVAYGGRRSVQLAITALIGQHLGLVTRLHIPEGAETPELQIAEQAGAVLIRHRAGYMSVLAARARTDAAAIRGKLVPYGLGSREVVNCIAKEASTISSQILSKIKRIVIPVGSGTNAAGVYQGIRDVPIVGVRVGANPIKHLNQLIPGWMRRMDLIDAKLPYEKEFNINWNGIDLDPVYEAKCVEFLKPGDLFWIVGRR